MEPIVGGFLIIFVGLSYLKYMISRHCLTNNQNQNQNQNMQRNDYDIPPKYEDIDNPPIYSDV